MSFSQESNTPPEKKDVQVESLQVHIQDIYTEDSLDPVYHAKAKILNNAFQEIGMGKYQVCPVCLYSFVTAINQCSTVAFILRSWVWLVFVSPQASRFIF